MALQLVYRVLVDGAERAVYADFVTREIQVLDEVGIPVYNGFDATGYDFYFGEIADGNSYVDDGNIMSAFCDPDFVYVGLQVSYSFPYAAFSYRANAVECGYGAFTCNVTFTTDVTSAVNGLNNGTINITASGGDNYEYSLDNFNWQSSNVFSLLFPGTYNVFVRDGNGCFASALVEVANTISTVTTIPTLIPYQDTKNLCYFFRLVIDEVTHEISEPIKWDDVQIEGERDKDYHGYQYKYTDGNVNLGFDCDAGKELIEAVYNTKGQDGEILFHFGYTYLGDEFLLFNGKLMLNTYKWYAEKIECTVEAEDFDSVFQSRLETKVDMTAVKTFDNEAVTPPPAYNLELHSKSILTKIICNNPGKTFDQGGIGGRQTLLFFKPDNSGSQIGEIQDYYEYPFFTSNLSPVEMDEYQFNFVNSGVLTATMSWSVDVVLTVKNSGVGRETFDAHMYFVRRTLNPVSQTFSNVYENITATPVNGVQLPGLSTVDRYFTISGSKDFSGNVYKGEQVFIYVEINVSDDVKMSARLTQTAFTLNVEQLETTPASNSKTWFIDDLLRHSINVISNNKYAFRSSFFERKSGYQLQDGCGSLSTVTNGFQIRQFEVADRPLKLELKKVLKSLNSQYCVGLNYSSSNDQPIIRIERVDYFYQDKQIIVIEFLKEYREEVAIDLIYNDLEIGYEKFLDEGYNTLDEFNTKHEYLLPIKKQKKKLSALSAFITSGYSIEKMRREQFAEKPSSSVSGDDDPFMVIVKRDSSNTYSTEKDEPFESVSNLISPSTSYNLRISPKRMLYNWFKWLRGVVFYKEDTDELKNTFAAQNGSLITRFKDTETCLVGDVSRSTIKENEDVTVSRMNANASIFQPEWVYFKCRLTPDKVQIMNLALTGKYPGKEYGYIMVKKPDATWQAGWVFKLTYNYWTEEAEIKMLKKHPTPVTPEEDCCDWLVVNGCYVKINDDKIIA